MREERIQRFSVTKARKVSPADEVADRDREADCGITKRLNEEGLSGVLRLYRAAQLAVGRLVRDEACPKNIQGRMAGLFISIDIYSPPGQAWVTRTLNRLWAMESKAVVAGDFSGAEILSEVSAEVERYGETIESG